MVDVGVLGHWRVAQALKEGKKKGKPANCIKFLI